MITIITRYDIHHIDTRRDDWRWIGLQLQRHFKMSKTILQIEINATSISITGLSSTFIY